MARSVLASSFCAVQGPDSLQKYGWVWGLFCPALHHHRIIAIACDRDVVSILLSLPQLNLASFTRPKQQQQSTRTCTRTMDVASAAQALARRCPELLQDAAFQQLLAAKVRARKAADQRAWPQRRRQPAPPLQEAPGTAAQLALSYAARLTEAAAHVHGVHPRKPFWLHFMQASPKSHPLLTPSVHACIPLYLPLSPTAAIPG